MDEEERRRQQGARVAAPERIADQQNQPHVEAPPAPEINDPQQLQRMIEYVEKNKANYGGEQKAEAIRTALVNAQRKALMQQQNGPYTRDDIRGIVKLPVVSTESVTNSVYKGRLNRLNQLLTSGVTDASFVRGDLRFFEDQAADVNNPSQQEAEKVAGDLVQVMVKLKQVEETAYEQSRAEQQIQQREIQRANNNPLSVLVSSIEGITEKEIFSTGAVGRKAREQIFNDILAEVDATPNKQFDQIFSVMTVPYTRYTRLKEILLSLSERGDYYGLAEAQGLDERQMRDLGKEAKQDLERFEKELNVRRTLHDALQVIYNPSVKADAIFDYVQGFSSQDGEYAYKMTGVREMMDLYESGLRQVMLENNGVLGIEDVLGKVVKRVHNGEEYTVLEPAKVDQRVKELYRELYNRQKVRAIGTNGEIQRIGGDGNLRDADVDKVFTIARGMMVTSLRLLSVASESRMPKEGLYTSLFMQDVIQSYTGYLQHIIAKFGIGEKGLALLVRSEEGKKLLGTNLQKLATLGRHNKLLADLIHNPDTVIYNLTDEYPEDLYVRHRNPNKCGDVFTYLSWRLKGDPESLSIAQEFVRRGIVSVDRDEQGNPVMKEGVMLKALKKKLGIADDVDLISRKKGMDYTKPSIDDPHGRVAMQDYEVVIHNIMSSQFAHLSGDQKEKAQAEIASYLNEYGRWIGTGVRFESLRGALEDPHDKGFAAAKEKAQALIERMVTLQAHRLYHLAPDIQYRLNLLTQKAPGGENYWTHEDIRMALEGLQLIEMNVLDKRDDLLAEGKSFDGIHGSFITSEKVELDFHSLAGDVEAMHKRGVFKSNEAYTEAREKAEKQQLLAKALYDAVQQDYRENKDIYHKKLITYRNYNYGAVLWTGDALTNEFDWSVIGPTAGFARRGRDNKSSAEAIGMEIGMIAGAKHNMSVDQVMGTLGGIYEKIANYDAGKAKSAVAEKAANAIDLFKGAWYTNLPVWGLFWKSMGKGSMARKLWGPEAALWTKTEINHFIETLHHKDLITHHDAQVMMMKNAATRVHAGSELTTIFGQFALLALIFYMAQQLTKEENK